MARDSLERDKQERARVTGTKPSLDLAAYAGTYRDDLYGDVTVAPDSGSLSIRFGPFYTGALSHWHYDTFKASWQDPEQRFVLVTFVLNADGHVDHLTWPGLGDFAKVSVTGP